MLTDLQRIVKLAEELRTQQAHVAELESQLAQSKVDVRRLEQEDLPLLMTELGLSQIKLADGAQVTVVADCTAGLTEATRASALAWLMEHGFAGLIKTEVTCAFGRGEHDAASTLANELAARALNPALEETVHPQTLKAFVKEQLAVGAPVPLDLFNVYTFTRAVIKAAPKKK